MAGIPKWRPKLVFGALIIAGAIGGASVSPAPAMLLVACEQDECDDHWYGSSCEANTGQLTSCDSGDSGCTTKACGRNAATEVST